MGGVNHCRSHWRLAKLRGFMYEGKYSAVIGFKTIIAWNVILGTYKNIFSDQSQRCISPRISNHKISPNDSVSDSGWPLPIILVHFEECFTTVISVLAFVHEFSVPGTVIFMTRIGIYTGLNSIRTGRWYRSQGKRYDKSDWDHRTVFTVCTVFIVLEEFGRSLFSLFYDCFVGESVTE